LLATLKQYHAQSAHYITCEEPFDRNNVNPQCTIANLNTDYTSKFNFTGFNYIFYDSSNTRTNYKNQIKRIIFKDSVLKTFPLDLFSTFVNMNDFSAQDCKITELCRHFFQGASELIKIDLSGNNIKILPQVAFYGAEKVQVLDLTINEISEIQLAAFHELPHLSSLKLSYNKITTIVKEHFPDLYYLDKIYLDNNRIASLSDDAFAGCTNLRYLWLGNNQLTFLNDLANLGQMRYIDLNNNYLQSLNFRKTQARTLYVTNNSLTSIYIPSTMEYLFAGNNKIETVEISDKMTVWELNLTKNNIKSLINITKITSVGTLDLSFNNIGPLNLTSFSQLQNLITLNLEATNISNVQYGTFSHQAKMKNLDISYNNLTTLDFHMFSAMIEMENLYINGNNLTEFDYEDLSSFFSNLTFIGLSDNQFNCTYLTRAVKKLKSLNVQIYIDPNNVITNATNVMGIECWSPETGRQMHLHTPQQHIVTVNSSSSKDMDDDMDDVYASLHHYHVLQGSSELSKSSESSISSGSSSALIIMNVVLVIICLGYCIVKLVYYVKKRESSGIISFNTRSNSVLTIEQNI
jgi:Leucine-rich repeat (LRR) protein